MQVNESRKESINVPFPHKIAETVHYMLIRLFSEHFTMTIDVYCKPIGEVEPIKLPSKHCAKVANLKMLVKKNVIIRL